MDPNDSKKPNLMLFAAGLLGALAIALGAYAAHGLEDLLGGLGYEGSDLRHRLEIFETGARYQLHTATALLAIGLLAPRRQEAPRRGLVRAAWLLGVGMLVFSGLLYALSFVGADYKWLGAIVPLGGLAMIVGWGLLAVEGLRWGRTQIAPALASANKPEDLLRVEELLTHQQQMLHDLDQVVTSVRREADTAQSRLESVEKMVRGITEQRHGAEGHGAEDDPDERPPHY